MELIECREELIERVPDAATNVHIALGLGLLELVYETALMMELTEMGIAARRQVEVPVSYRGRDLGLAFRADIIVENCLVLEIKAVERITDLYLAQIMNYQKLLRFKRGYILNFNRKLMKEGIKRVSI